MPPHRRPRSYYDRFADTPWGDSTLKWFWGTEKEPPNTLFHRTLPKALGAGAYVADRAFQTYYGFLPEADPDDNPTTDTMYGSAGAGGAAYGARSRAGMSQYRLSLPTTKFKAAGKRVHRTLGPVPRVLRQNYRLRQNLPVSVAHEETSDIRTKPGTQGVVLFQAERLLPSYTSGVPTTALNTSVNRRSDNTIGTYNGGITFDQIYRFPNSSSDSRAAGQMTYRHDWTMFTNPSWRDGLSVLNGRRSTVAGLKDGYQTPFYTGAAAHENTYFRRENVATPYSTTETSNPFYAWAVTDYHHLGESITWTLTNNGAVPVSVTLYECILAHDVRMAVGTDSAGSATTITWGALPDPVECWRAGSQMAGGEGQGMLVTESYGYNTTVGGRPQGDDGEGATGTAMGGGSAAAGGFTGTGTVGSYLPDVDHPWRKPGGPMLHHWYKVVPHTRTIGPGQTSTISVSVSFNKRIPGLWWESLVGVKGMSRTFFMVTRPTKVVGSTGIDEAGVGGEGSRLMVMAATDITMKWVKTKSFTRAGQLGRRKVYYRATVPEIDATAQREEDGDVNGDAYTMAGAPLGGDDGP